MIKLHFNLESGDYKINGEVHDNSETALLRAMISRVTPNLLKNPVKWISITVTGVRTQIEASDELTPLKEYEVKPRIEGLVKALKKSGVTPF